MAALALLGTALVALDPDGDGDPACSTSRSTTDPPTPAARPAGSTTASTSAATTWRSSAPATGISVPQKSQGVAVTAGQPIFSTSYGRRSHGTVRVVPRGRQVTPGAAGYCLRVPSMNEGVTVLDGRLHLLVESGAQT